MTGDRLLLDGATRDQVWKRTWAAVEQYLSSVAERPVTRGAVREEVRDYARQVRFEAPVPPVEAIGYVVQGFDRFHVHNSHPGYFGLFIPGAGSMGVAADALTAAFNPVLAAWRLGPFAVELELHLIAELAARFGFDPVTTEGSFTSGGSEANHTGVLCALFRAFPEIARDGLCGLAARPVLYISGEGHHSIDKAACVSGLGSSAVRHVPVDDRLRLDVTALEAMIAADRAAGLAPFLIVATAGTTNAGVIDPLAEVAAVARRQGLWLHVDAAWGGAGAFLSELRAAYAGLEGADSITFDAHKWLSVPMGAGLFLTRHPGLLESVFTVDDPYMPRTAGAEAPVDFYRRSLQWARRFIGLKVFLTLAVMGWSGYEQLIREQVRLGERLRERLRESGFEVVNDTPLPVVCFVDPQRATAEQVDAMAAAVVAGGRAWISSTRIGTARRPMLRAAVTSFRTGEEDIEALLAALEQARP